MNQNLSEGLADLSLGEICLKEIGRRQALRHRQISSWITGSKGLGLSGTDNLGDQPTNFFYKSMKTRKGRNEISTIKDSSGNGTANKTKIKEEFISFFSKLFNQHPPPPVAEEARENNDEWFGNLPSLTSDQVSHLEQPFSSEEIKASVFSMKPLKSPGPHGIPPVFYQKK